MAGLGPSCYWLNTQHPSPLAQIRWGLWLLHQPERQQGLVHPQRTVLLASRCIPVFLQY